MNRKSIVGFFSVILTTVGGVAVTALLSVAAPPEGNGAHSDVTKLAEGFARPPAAVRPRVWWHWMNGNVSKAGITADLEAMAKAGIGGAHLFDVGCGIPPGDVKFNTPSWDEHVDWAAREAERLGLELTLVNCSGFANAGGPWIAPSNSMFFVRHTETAVKGGTTFRGVLPRAKNDHGFYRDIAVLAFPRPACERAPSGGLRVSSPAPWVRVVSADEPFALGGFTFSATYGWGWNVTAKVRVEVSDDGQAWRETETIDVWLSNSGRSDCINGDERYVAFTRPTLARQVRVTMEPEDKTFVYESFRPELRRGLPELNARTFRSYDNFAPCAHEVGADGAVDPKRIVDLTDRLGDDGTLEWTVPAGDDWIVLRVGYASNGAVVHPASSFGGGLEVDKLDAAAVGFHFDSYAGRLAKGHKSVKAVLCDSYEVGTQNWTHGLEKTFARRKGYSLVPYLVAFSGRVVGSVKRTDEALWDFRRLISDLFVENFVDECARKARAAGLRYAMEPYGNMSADATHYAAHADLPMSEFWVTADDGVPTDHVGHSDITKGVASAAHLHGRDGVDAEAFTAFPLKGGRWLKDPFGLKAMGDFYYTLGVTRMVYHRFAHQPWTEPARLPGMTMGQWGTHFERTETWWPMIGPWVDYQSRCQFLLAAGHPANDLVVYVGDEVPNLATPEVKPDGWSWDVCGFHDLEELSVVGGRLVPKDAHGVSYAALVVPTNRLVTAASRKHLDRLKAAGATLIKSGERPSLAPDFTYSGTDEKVRSICRCHDDGTRVWFVAYPSTNAAVVRCSFRAVGTPELWDAETGERFRPYDWKAADGRTEVMLPFRPCGSWFVVIQPGKVRSSLPVLADPAKVVAQAVTEVEGPWELAFPKGWNCPEKVTLPKLVSWTEIPDGEVRYFSGIATYAKTVELPQDFADGKGRIVLDLGRVKNVAEVTVNGKTYPPLWRPPFRVDVTDAVRAGEPMRLAVRVANLWPNRLIGDEQKPADCEWGYLWDKLAIKEIPEWVKSGKPSPTGRLAFTTWHHWTKDDKLVESGLIGPVNVEYVVSASDHPIVAEPGVPFCALRFGYRYTEPAKWAEMRAALEKNRGAFDEVWFSTGVSFPKMSWHEESARQCAAAAADLRKMGIVPSIEIQTIIGHTDAILGEGDCSGQDWGTWVGADGTVSRHVACPHDPRLAAYFVRVGELHAAWKPGSMWIDDDVTLRNRAPMRDPSKALLGCFCERCIGDFARRDGRAWSRAALAEAIRADAAVARRWDEYQSENFASLVKTIAAAVHKVSPETVFGYQYGGTGRPAIVKGIFDGCGIPVRLRPGAGAYWDTYPHDQIVKAYQLQDLSAMMGRPDWIGARCPEIESCPRTFACRTPQGIILEAFENLALGMDFLSMFVADARTDETTSFYADRLFPRLAAAQPFLRGYRDANRGTVPCGLSAGEAATEILTACRGIPIVNGFGRSLGTLPPIESIKVRTSGSGTGLAGADYRMRVLQISSSTGLMDFARRADEASGERLPVLFDEPTFAFAVPRVRPDGTLATLAVVNASIDRQDPVGVRLRGVPEGAATAVWHTPENGPVALNLERQGGFTHVTLPQIGAWQCGYLSFEI